MKSIASVELLNINIRTMSSSGNAVDRGPTVCARFKVCKALALTCIEYTYTKLMTLLLTPHLQLSKVHNCVHIAGFHILQTVYVTVSLDLYIN